MRGRFGKSPRPPTNEMFPAGSAGNYQGRLA
jgi:hypothetical protein